VAYGELGLEPREKGGSEVEALTFHRLPVTDRRSGGVITTAATMTMTSGTDRTKPITRGAWIAGVIFNNPPEPPPANVPALGEKPPSEEEHLTLRERLSAHRERADCRGCHEQIDPLGFALENFDPIGNWRSKYENGRDVDMAGTLFRKHPFNNVVEFIRLMGDLMVVALQTGLTNVATFMVGPERWDTPYQFEGLFDKPRSHHEMSHNQTKMIDDLLKVDRFHMQQYVYLLEKMDAIKETDGSSLLDNTLFTYGSGLGDGSTHQYNDLPIIVAGSGGGKFKTGQHINMPEGTPLANLWLTQARAMDMQIDRFADSSGEIAAVKAS
jgi:hypothetical protein